MATVNQIEANQANSLLSTGPTSELGKLISSKNALKHGLAGKGLILPDEEMAAAKKRTLELIESLKPADALEHTFVEQIAFEEIRAACCRNHQNARRELKAKRAVNFWDKDRRLAAEFLFRGIHKKPEIVSRQLQQTKQGNELLIEYWQGLAGALYKNGDWDDSQRAMALDLMGVPEALRNGWTKLDTPEGHTGPEWLGETITSQISILQEQMPALGELDECEQEMAMYGIDPTPDSEMKRLQRYESAALRRMQWAYRQLEDRKRGRQPRAPRAERSAPKELTRAELRARALKEEEELDALRYESWRMMDEVGIHRELCSEALIREAARTAIAIDPKPAIVPPSKPTSSSPPPPQFKGNRRARRAAELQARRANRS